MNAETIKEKIKQVQQLTKSRNFNEVIKNSKEILQDLEKRSFSLEDKLKFQIQIYYDYGVACYEKQMWDETIKICQQAIDLLQTDILKKELSILKHMNTKINIRFLMSIALQKQGNLDEAIENFEINLKTMSGAKMGDKLTTKQYATKTFIHQILGTIYDEKGNKQKAVENYEMALSLLRKKIMK